MFTKCFLFLRSLKLILAFLVLAGAAHAEIEDLTGDVWSVCGWDGLSSWDDTRLVFTNQIDGEVGVELEGYFDWLSDQGSTGREHFRGTLKSNGDLALQGFSLKGSNNIVNSRYEGRLSANGMTIVDGVWLDGLPGIWAAVRDGGIGSAARLCEQSDQLS